MLQPRLSGQGSTVLPRWKETGVMLVAVLVLGLCQLSAGDISLVNSDSSQLLANENQQAADPESNAELDRTKRNLGDVNVTLLSDSSESKVYGLISSAARTFVQDGITTEFTTQLVGTNIGGDYSRILNTGSKILYGNLRSKTGNSEPYLIYPTANNEFDIAPTNVQEVNGEYQTTLGDFDVPTLKDILSNSQDDLLETSEARNIVSPTESNERTPSMESEEDRPLKDSRETSERAPDSENVISVRKEYSTTKNNGEVIKPQKVKAKANLPTYTIKNGYDSFLFEDDLITEEPKYDSNQLFRKPVIIKNDINFEAIAKKQQRISKSLLYNRNNNFREVQKEKDQTVAIQNEKSSEKSKLVTTTYFGFADFTTTVGNTVIHFMPNTPVVLPNNNLVTSIKDEATLRNELIRPSKVQNNILKTNVPNSVLNSNKLKNPVEASQAESHEKSSKHRETEPLFKYRSSTTRIYNTEVQALGLVKSIGGIESYEGTTTEFTTFVYGTYINGDYKQLLQSATNIKINPTKALNSVASASSTKNIDRATTTTPKDEEDNKVSENPTESNKVAELSNQDNLEGSESVEYVAKTSYKTYTYLTTFFIPIDDDVTTTSVRSRDVVSSIVTYVPSSIKPTKAAEIIKPSEEIVTPLTTTPSTTNAPTTTEESREVTSPISNDSDMVTTESTTEKEDQSATTITENVSSTTQKNKEQVNDNNDEDKYTTLDAYETTESVIISTTEKKSLNAETLPSPTPTIKSEKDDEENDEVELIFKTLYTTYTYLTTYFEESSSSISSREEIVTNVVTSTIDKSFFSNDAVEGLFERNENSLISSDAEKIKGTNLVTSENNTKTVDEKTVYTTYTYFTTVFGDDGPSVTSRTDVVTNIIQPTSTVPEIIENTNTVVDITTTTEESEEEFLESTTPYIAPSYSNENVTSSTTETLDDISSTEILTEDSTEGVQNIKPGRPQERKFTYDTTMSRNHERVSSNDVEDEEESLEQFDANYPDIKEKDIALSKEEDLLRNSYRNEYMVNYINSTRSKETINRKMIILSDSEEDQISSETNTEETEPSLLLQTSYTTFTYFTTLYKGSSSDIVSRLETVTNVITETVQPTVVTENILDLEDDVPITYYTTFTYWTTLYKEGSTMITSREETQSNIITPTVNRATEASTMEITPTPTMSIDTTATTSSSNQPGDLLEPTTYFTTYTYFTTSYLGNSTIVNSRLETETNVITPSETIVETSDVEPTPALSIPAEESETTQKLEPTGLISTIAITDVLEGITTILSTDVFGTYIDGLYAQVLESTTKILSSETVPVVNEATLAPSENQAVSPQSGEGVKPTGVVSLNEGSTIDAEGITTTFYTTKAIGTYIDGLYAQVIESTSSVKVDEERKTTLPDNDPATIIIGDKSYKTGLVKIIEGQIVKDKTTTFYESKVIGTIIDDRYAQVIESTSSVSIEPTANADEVIKPTTTQVPELNITPTEQPTVPASTPAVESSQGEKGEDEDDEENKIGSKKKFAPVIRPFASRPRPTFLPKKKTGEPAIAQTITRGITPTIVATPALKATSVSNVFGASSRNRFAASRRPSVPQSAPVSENAENIRPTSSSRKFSRPSKSSGSALSSFSPSSRRGGSSSARVVPTPTPVVSSNRRGPNYRTSASVRPSLELGLRSTGPNSRFRVRPTPTSSLTRASTVSTTPEPVEDNEELNNTSEEEDEEDQTVGTTTTTTESSRRQNPLLRLRRPPLGRTAASPTPPPPPSPNIPTTRATLRPSGGRATTSRPASTTKRGSATSRTNGNKGTTTTTSRPTTTRPRPVYNNNNRPRPRPANSLLPGRLPSRRPVEEPKEEEPVEQELDEEKNQQLGQIEEEESDNFFEGSETEETKPIKNEEDNKISRKPASPVSIRPFNRRRNKRQADFGYRYDSRNSRSNRRPAPRIQASDYYYYDDDVPIITEAPKVQNTRSRFNPRNQQPVQQQQQFQQQQQLQQGFQQKITPATTSNFNTRQQFTLRESKPVATTPRTNYRRPPNSRRQEVVTTPPPPKRPSPPRLKNNYRESTRKTPETRRFNPSSNTRRTPSTRQRFTTENFNNAYVPPIDDGSITVTLKTPTEVTIPVVNGKFTEYKNVLTAKPSYETLGPHQYTSVIGKNGLGTLQYANDVTETLPNGNTEITKFVIFETPTTTIVFTPTTIRGRKTSFSHIVPSTIYDVRPEVSTITPNLGNAPLANLLLSQLLLGNLNLQPTANPLGVVNPVPMTPVTEYKTKSTTYVTTVTSISSAVLPLTFRGKEITTTIIESSTQVITATEYMTETIVITPTPVANQGIPAANQFNTLLLPALLQAQLLQQPTPTPVTNFLPDVPLTEEEAQKVNARSQSDFQVEEVQQNNNEEDNYSQEKISSKKSKYKKQQEPAPVASSIVTLYVSGRRPGEFSTVLSTYYDDNATQRKREVTVDFLQMEASEVKPSKMAFFQRQPAYDLDDVVMSAINDISVESSEIETQPLETRYIIEKFKTHSTAPNLKSKTIDPHLDPNLDPGEVLFDIITFGQTDSEQNKNGTGYFLADSPADKTPYQQGRATPRSTHRIVRRDLTDSEHTKDITTEKNEQTFRKIILKKKKNSPRNNNEEITTWKPAMKKSYKSSAWNIKSNSSFIKTENSNRIGNDYIKIIEANEDHNEGQTSGKRIRVIKRLKTIPHNPNEEYLTGDEPGEGFDGKVVKKQLNPQEVFKNDLSDFDKTKTLLNLNSTHQVMGKQDSNNAHQGRILEGSVLLNGEARVNLATKVMSNGVQVIVAGDRTTYPGDNHYRILTANVTRPITLAPSTISNHMVMLLPHETQNLNNQFITKTYLTTYTYLTTFLQANQTKTTSSEEVISNVVTEDVKNPHTTAPVMQNQITLTSPVDLVTQVFHTTYTYLNTLLDEEQPIVLTTKKTILNTVTSLSSEIDNAIETSYDVIQDTNTYINTVQFTKTISDGHDLKVISTQDVLTQVIITQSDKPAGATSVEQIQPATTDVTKTYFVTYTYYNTIQEGDGNTVVTSEIATSSDVVTEKFHLQTKKPEFHDKHHEKDEHKKPTSIKEKIKDKHTNNHKEELSKPDRVHNQEQNIEPTETAMLFESESNNIHIFATKTYLTTYTYFTTLLSNEQTVVNSRTKIIENIVTETLASSLLDENQMSSLRSSLKQEDKIVSTATLKSGEKIEITAMNHVPQDYNSHNTRPYHNEIQSSYETEVKQTAGVNVEFENKKKTPVLQTKFTLQKKPTGNVQTQQVHQKDKVTATNVKNNSGTSYLKSSTVMKNGATLLAGTPVIKVTNGDGNETVIPVSDPISKHPDSRPPGGVGMNDLLSLGSLSNSLTALKPVLSAMAGYIKNNLKTSETKYKNESIKLPASSQNYRFPTFSKNDQVKPLSQHEGHFPLRNQYEDKSTPNSLLRSSTRAPIYIPLSELSNERDIEPQESQVIESNQYADTFSRNTIHSASLKATSEKPLLNGGIPISPGEVITANSDVIVGRPSVLGVRPPEPKKPQDTVPIGMRPPPPPSQGPPVSYKENIFSSSNKEETKYSPLKFNPLPAATTHLVEYNDIIPDLRPPAPPSFNKQKQNLPIRPTKVNNEHANHNPFQHKHHSGSIQLNPFSNAQIDIQKGSQIYEEHESHEAPQISGSQHIHTYENFENREPVVILDSAPKFVEHSSVDPLLVNLQPSQVANVVIPHGSQTALIYSDQGNKHGPKGEVFNEAPPSSAMGVKIYSSPPTAVGAVSTNHIYTMNNVPTVGTVHQAVIPNDQMNFNVAVAPTGINVGLDSSNYGNKPKTSQSEHRDALQHGNVHKILKERPELRPGPEQRPVSYQTNEQIHIHKKPSHINEEYLGPPPPLPEDFTNEGELIQESNTRPLTPGQVPDEIKFKQNNYKSPPPSSPGKPSVEYILQYGNKKRPQPRPTSEYSFEKVKPTGEGVLEYQNPNKELKREPGNHIHGQQNKPTFENQGGYSQQNKQPFEQHIRDQHKQEPYNRNQAEQLHHNEKVREQQKQQYEQHVRDQQKQFEQQKQKYEDHLKNQKQQQQQQQLNQQHLQEHKQFIRDSQKNSIVNQQIEYNRQEQTKQQNIQQQQNQQEQQELQQQQQLQQQRQQLKQQLQINQEKQQHNQQQHIQQQQQQYERQQNRKPQQIKKPTAGEPSGDYEEEQLKLEQEVLNILHQHQEQLNKYASKPVPDPAQKPESSQYSVVVNHPNVPGHSNTHLQQHLNQKPHIETHNNEWHEVGYESTTVVEPKQEYITPTTHKTHLANNHHESKISQNTNNSPNLGKLPYHQNGHQIPMSMYDVKYDQNSQSEEGLSVPRPTLNELDIKAQIITGKPEKENGFHGNSQVLSIGKPTMLTPEGSKGPGVHSVGSSISFEKPHSVGSSISFESTPHNVGSSISFESKPTSVGSSISFESRPSEDNRIASSEIRQKVKGIVTSTKEVVKPVLESNEIKQFTSNEVRPILPSDPTVATMNMDEKIPPPPASPVRSKTPEPSPSGEVLGLSPPPVQRYQEDIRPTTRRPPFRVRPPKVPRPASPYKFEMPAANTTLKLEKPAVGKVESVTKWQTSTTKKPVNLLRPNDNFLPGPVQISQGESSNENNEGQRVNENNQGQIINENIQGQRLNENSQGQRVRGNAQGQRINDNNQGQRVIENIQGQRTNENIQGQRMNENIQGQRITANNQGQRIQNSQSLSVSGIGASVAVSGNYLKPEVMVAPSKVAMNDIRPSRPSKPSPPALKTVVLGKPIAQDVIAGQDSSPAWTSGAGSVLVGSESEEPPIPAQSEPKVKTLLSKTGTTTVFTNLYTKPTLKIKPTRTTVAHHSVISMVVDKSQHEDQHGHEHEHEQEELEQQGDSSSPQIAGVQVHEEDRYQISNMQGSMTELPTRFVTHTQTLSVTITETTVIQSSGQKPSTHTLVLTKTHTSTMIDTVTEFHTLLRPTKILATVTTTVPVPVTATQYSPYFTGSAHPAPVHPELVTAPPVKKSPHENESILLVVTDKKPGSVPLIERPIVDIQVPDETNEINPNDVLISGILTHSSDIDCRPECKASRNEVCQRVAESNVMRCACRPGFSRMFVDRPCKPTYSYTMKLALDRNGKEKIRYSDSLHDISSPGYLKLAAVIRDGLDRLVMQSELRDVYQGLEINRFDPLPVPQANGESALVNFHLQLSDNTEDAKLKEVLRKSLRHNNYSLGGTEVFAAREYLQNLDAEDFDECTSPRYHDCSENAQCFNLKGTYTCSCKDGYIDASHNTLYPGRICNELTGCESCNYHGTCYTEGQNEIVCECFHWYTGEHCQVNLKILLLALLAAGVLLTLLLIVCLLVGARGRRQGPPTARALLKIQARHNAGFRRYIGPSAPLAGDKRAIVMNSSSSSSSEASVEVTPPPYVKQPMSSASHTQRAAKMMGRKGHRAPQAPPLGSAPGPPGSRTSTFRSGDQQPQRDRSLTVMIPRAKYRALPPPQGAPATPTSLMTMSTFGPEQKLLSYLTVERANTPDKQASRSSSRKPSNSTSQSAQIVHRKSTPPRKPSTGALVSAGYEVSATVGRTKELDEAYMARPHEHHNPAFSTIRTADSTSLLIPTLDTFLEDVISSRLDQQRNSTLTVSEARSYDETTIQPPTRSYHQGSHHFGGPGGASGHPPYSGGTATDSKHSSSGKTNNDEGHTMVERDLGSTYLMPQRHLYKLDHSRQGSDGSNFDSL